MDLFGIGSTINALSNLATGTMNYKEAKKAREENMAFQREQFEYLKNQNALQQQREDTAVQRKMQDLRNSGLNPLSADATGGASTGATGATTSFSGEQAPQMQTDLLNGLQIEADSLYNLMSAKGNLAQQQAQTEYLQQQKTESEARVTNTFEDTNLKKKEQEKIADEQDNIRANTWATEEKAATENYNRQYSQGRNLRTTDSQGNISFNTPLGGGSVDRTFLDSVNPASGIMNKLGFKIGDLINNKLDNMEWNNENSYNPMKKYRQMRGGNSQ